MRANQVPGSQTYLAWDTLLDLGERGGPLHHRLAQAIRAAIRAGTLPHGGALPPSRTLADDLGCSRWVVTEAYQQLVAEATTAPHTELAYPSRGGHPRLRQVLAEYLQRVRGTVVEAEDVTITSGATNGVTQVCCVLAASGAPGGRAGRPGAGRRRPRSRGRLTAGPSLPRRDGLPISTPTGDRDLHGCWAACCR